jgi:hypothetical protein
MGRHVSHTGWTSGDVERGPNGQMGRMTDDGRDFRAFYGGGGRSRSRKNGANRAGAGNPAAFFEIEETVRTIHHGRGRERRSHNIRQRVTAIVRGTAPNRCAGGHCPQLWTDEEAIVAFRSAKGRPFAERL